MPSYEFCIDRPAFTPPSILVGLLFLLAMLARQFVGRAMLGLLGNNSVRDFAWAVVEWSGRMVLSRSGLVVSLFNLTSVNAD
jgi:hypothetical protein